MGSATAKYHHILQLAFVVPSQSDTTKAPSFFVVSSTRFLPVPSAETSRFEVALPKEESCGEDGEMAPTDLITSPYFPLTDEARRMLASNEG